MPQKISQGQTRKIGAHKNMKLNSNPILKNSVSTTEFHKIRKASP